MSSLPAGFLKKDAVMTQYELDYIELLRAGFQAYKNQKGVEAPSCKLLDIIDRQNKIITRVYNELTIGEGCMGDVLRLLKKEIEGRE